MPAQRADIHGFARAPFRVFQIKAGAERLCAAGQNHHRGFAVILKAAGGVGELTQRLRRQRIEAIAAVETHDRNTAFRPEPLLDGDELCQRLRSLPLLVLMITNARYDGARVWPPAPETGSWCRA